MRAEEKETTLSWLQTRMRFKRGLETNLSVGRVHEEVVEVVLFPLSQTKIFIRHDTAALFRYETDPK